MASCLALWNSPSPLKSQIILAVQHSNQHSSFLSACQNQYQASLTASSTFPSWYPYPFPYSFYRPVSSKGFRTNGQKSSITELHRPHQQQDSASLVIPLITLTKHLRRTTPGRNNLLIHLLLILVWGDRVSGTPADLKLTVQLRVNSNSWPSCFGPLDAGITSMCLGSQALFGILVPEISVSPS